MSKAIIIKTLSKAQQLARYKAQDTTTVVKAVTNSADDVFKQAKILQRKAKHCAQDVSTPCEVADDFLQFLRSETGLQVQSTNQASKAKLSTGTTSVQKNGKIGSKKSKYLDSDSVQNKIPIMQIQNAHVTINNWGNTGWKLHLPVQPDVNDPLTRDICNFLNTKWGLDISKRVTRGGQPTKAPSFFQQGKDGLSRYKVGQCSNTRTGKGMTIYGTTGNQEEIFELAQEIETLFGKRIAKSGCPIYAEEMHLTPHVSARFVDPAEILSKPKRFDYCQHLNKDIHGTVIGRNYGAYVSSLDNLDTSHWPKHVLGNKVLENEFMAGDSVIETIRDYGEMFTGKIVEGKIPNFILESFSPEYLKYHPKLIQELPDIIQQGNLRYVKSMLKDIVSDRIMPISGNQIPILGGQKGKISYLSQIDKKLIEQAKKELLKEDPNFLLKFNTSIQSESTIYPELLRIL